MKCNLYFCMEHPKPTLVMIGSGSPYAVHKHVDGKDHRTTVILRDVEIGDLKKDYPDPKAIHATLQAKHGPAALAAHAAAKK